MANHSGLTLYYHPLASFCHKVLIALYENDVAFEGCVVDLADEQRRAEVLSFWPVGKIPVLRDERRGQTVPETTVIIEHLARHYPGPVPLLPADPDDAADVRLWDRFFDLYVSAPMQKIVTDRLRPPGRDDAFGVGEARDTLARAYALLEARMGARTEARGRTWAAGRGFSLADCAAAPALFFAGIVAPFADTHPAVAAYFERLLARSSVARTIAEARPYFGLFPYRAEMPARFAAAAAEAAL